MFVCLSVCYGFTVEIYGFMHSLCTFWYMLLMMPSRDGMEIEVEDLEDRRRRQNEYGRWLTAQQKDERQDNGDKKRLARHHPSDLLWVANHCNGVDACCTSQCCSYFHPLLINSSQGQFGHHHLVTDLPLKNGFWWVWLTAASWGQCKE